MRGSHPQEALGAFSCLIVQSLSCVRLFCDTMDYRCHQAPLFMEFSRQEYWNGLPFASPGDLPDPRIEPASPALTGGFFTAEPHQKPLSCLIQETQERRVHPWVRKISFSRKWHLTPIFLPRKFHRQRSLVGQSPGGCKELDMTEQLRTIEYSQKRK